MAEELTYTYTYSYSYSDGEGDDDSHGSSHTLDGIPESLLPFSPRKSAEPINLPAFALPTRTYRLDVDLPLVVLLRIMSFCSPDDIVNLSATSRTLFKATENRDLAFNVPRPPWAGVPPPRAPPSPARSLSVQESTRTLLLPSLRKKALRLRAERRAAMAGAVQLATPDPALNWEALILLLLLLFSVFSAFLGLFLSTGMRDGSPLNLLLFLIPLWMWLMLLSLMMYVLRVKQKRPRSSSTWDAVASAVAVAPVVVFTVLLFFRGLPHWAVLLPLEIECLLFFVWSVRYLNRVANDALFVRSDMLPFAWHSVVLSLAALPSLVLGALKLDAVWADLPWGVVLLPWYLYVSGWLLYNVWLALPSSHVRPLPAERGLTGAQAIAELARGPSAAVVPAVTSAPLHARPDAPPKQDRVRAWCIAAILVAVLLALVLGNMWAEDPDKFPFVLVLMPVYIMEAVAVGVMCARACNADGGTVQPHPLRGRTLAHASASGHTRRPRQQQQQYPWGRKPDAVLRGGSAKKKKWRGKPRSRSRPRHPRP